MKVENKNAHRAAETILLDDTDVAEPKKSGGFFSWLMGG